MIQEFARDRLQPLHPHEHDLSSAKLSERLKIDGACFLLRIFMSGEKCDMRCFFPMCHRDAGISRASNGRRNARHDFERNSRGRKSERLFRAAPEKKWIATF